MKKILFTLLIFVFVQNVIGQGINFQGVARSANGTILASQKISLKLSIITGSSSSTPEYVETRSVTTNAQGIFSIVVGDTGSISTIGTFESISWKINSKFLKVEMDPNNGTNFISMGTTQLQYVPFSYYSNGVDAANIAGVLPVKSGGTGVVSISDLKAVLILDKVNNTADSDKPISTLAQTAIDTKLNKKDTINLSNRIDAIIKTKEIILKDIVINGVNAGIGGGKSNTNTLFGYGSLQKNTTGQDNTAIGSYALSENITGYNNTAVGGGALGLNTTGYLNTAIGRFALGSITSGNRNTSIGNGALGLITDGIANTAIGFSALSKQTSFGPNDAFGSESQSNLTTGAHNTSFGQGTLRNNINGSGNAAFGVSTLDKNLANSNSGFGANALLSNTTGEGNTAVGSLSGRGNTTGSNNTFLGSNTDVSSAIISNSTAIGYNAQITASNTFQLGNSSITDVKTSGILTAAGYKIPGGTSAQYLRADGTVTTSVTAGVPYTGASQAVDLGAFDMKVNGISVGTGSGVLSSTITNLVVGKNSLMKNTTGRSNTAIGVDALVQNTSGSNNTAIGNAALYSNTNGSRNTAIGIEALLYNISGAYNIGIGEGVLANSRTASYNTVMGWHSLFNSTGNFNTVMGYGSMSNNTTGENNSSIGVGALNLNKTGNNNTSLGAGSLMANLSADNNVAVGLNALAYNTVGYSNTAIGTKAGYANIDGNRNTAIGDSAFLSGTGFSNITAIGYNAQVTASNTIQLGNNEITDVKTSGVITTRGIGIGTKSNTSAALEVNSTSQGFLPPRMTAAQRDIISTPVAGLVVWCTNCAEYGELQVYNGNTWTNMIGGAASLVPNTSSTPPPIVVAESDIVFKVEVAGAEVNYSNILAVVGTSQVLNVNITSTLPKDGVSIFVSVKKRSDNTVVFSANLSSSAAINPVTITGLTAGVLCEATVTVTSKSKVSNTASKSFSLASK